MATSAFLIVNHLAIFDVFVFYCFNATIELLYMLTLNGTLFC